MQEPRQGQLGGANTTADGLLRLVDDDLQPARASAIAAASPFGPEPITTAPHARSERSAGPNAWPSPEHGLEQVAVLSIRSSASRIPKSRGRTSSLSSSQRSGVDTGAPGFGRTE